MIYLTLNVTIKRFNVEFAQIAVASPDAKLHQAKVSKN